ncbi:MAG TPA: alanine--tRNA ligase [Armatimonadota bacterium]|jgi:alanyl-tRNA synthetase
MKPRTSNEIRQAFLDFFAARGHYVHPGISLVPTDPSIFLTSAGVVIFRDVIEGREKADHARVAGCQRCARTTDIENVGRYGRYHTFFEMLGNFSFGDYYKRESLIWGVEFIRDVLGMDMDRVWATIYPDDEEAYRIWTEEIGLRPDHVVRLADNWWGPLAIPGACGPDSELYYDLGPDYEGDAPGDEGDRYLEFWNHVFTEFQKQPDGSFVPLPTKNIDTGMGLERLTRIVQGVNSVYDTDLFAPIMAKVSELVEASGGKIEGDDLFRQRIIADHARAATFMIMDGILPENSGREYILRRLIRRADREGVMLGIEGPFLHTIVPIVVEQMKPGYPQLVEKQAFITKALLLEEERFFQLLPQGINALETMLREEGRTALTGAEAFQLWSSYGFPIEMTQEILAERGFPPVDIDEYTAAEAEHSDLSGKHGSAKNGPDVDLGKYPATEFVGYDTTEAEVTVFDIVDGNKAILDRSPFYAESGGQTGDTGTIGNARVLNTTKVGGIFIHEIDGSLNPGDNVVARVDTSRRRAITRAHTATHLLHWALHQVVGVHATQKGSLVEPDRLRFDFASLAALTAAEVEQIERLVNERVLENAPVCSESMPISEARKMGAMMLFGEKYGSEVRVVSVGDYSKELCGGTHAQRAGDIGLFKISSESGIASGTRRIEAVTGLKSWEYARERDTILQNAVEQVGGTPADVPAKVAGLLSQIAALKKDVSRLRKSGGAGAVRELANTAVVVCGVKLVSSVLDDADAEQLKSAADEIADTLKSGVVVLGAAAADGKAMFVAKVTKDLTKQAHAGNLVREVAKVAGGGGGGRPDFAQAGGKDASKVADAVAAAEPALRAQLGRS